MEQELQPVEPTKIETIYDVLKKTKPVDATNYPLVNEEGRKLTREFLGDIFGRGILQKEFHAYLKGKSTFMYKKQRYAVRQQFAYLAN